MPGGVRVLTDSAASLPADLVASHRIEVVPLHVVIDGSTRAEGIEVDGADVALALRRRSRVSTSRPTPLALLEGYERLAADGAEAIVSVHLSAAMSGTWDAARLAGRDAPVPVRVVDSRSVGWGQAYAVLAACGAASTGAAVDEVAAAAEDHARLSRVYFYVDTLEHLRRGGRVGAAQALIGSALAVKPLLELVDGRIEPLERVRTAGRALARLEELTATAAGAGPVDVGVQHLGSPERAEELAGRLRGRIPGIRRLDVGEVGAVVGAHVGPGLLAVVVAPVTPHPVTSPPQAGP